MTNMQVEYNKLVEARRHNIASERLGASELAESVRHAKVTEAISEADLNERIRHQQAQDAETMRHNGASEAEILRHNLATEAQARADNDLKKALSEMQIVSNERINAAKMANDRYINEQNLAYKKASDELNRALEKYKTDTSKLLKESELTLTSKRIENETQKLKADIAKMEADTLNNVKKTALEYAKNPKAALIADAMMAGSDLAEMSDMSVPSVAKATVEAIMAENNMDKATDRDAKWWTKAINVFISQGKATTVFGFLERKKELDALDKIIASNSKGVPGVPKLSSGGWNGNTKEDTDIV